MPVEKVVETDVLVVGGGMAGIFAAIKAKEQGVEVLLVDKGYAGKSGQTPWAGSYAVFNPEWGDKMDGWVEQVSRVGQYVNNRAWTELCFKDSYARYQDLVSWGVEFRKNNDGSLFRAESMLGPCRAFLMPAIIYANLLRKQALKVGVKIMDRIMITDLLKQDGKVVGAVGIPMESYETFIFKARATVLCSGAGGFKPLGWPISALTSDGDAMAYRAGCEITGKEFADTHGGSAANTGYRNLAQRMKGDMSAPPERRGRIVNAEGNPLPERGTLNMEMEFEAHAGRAPIYRVIENDKFVMVGGASSGMSVHKAEGIWPAGMDCSTAVPGLYAAGDALGTMQMGGAYGSIGTALGGSSVTGAIAGVAAARYARKTVNTEEDKTRVEQIKKTIFAPAERKGGFSPRWVTQVLQNAVVPYFIQYVKKEDRLKAALTTVEFLRDHMVPMLFARDPHELRMALETRNMILNAEMRLRASLFRTESRGCHYREDYPHRDDPAWLAWVLLKEEGGQMKAYKKPIPEAWWPDLSKPYAERYPWQLPGDA